MTREFQVQKDDIGHHRVIDTPPGEDDASLDDDGVRVGISRFAFTANNITYAVVGERMGYWQFFPPCSADAAGWGIIPVWGFAEVIESKNADIAAGERLFGYFPTATQLRLKATRVSQQRFVDGSIHRAGIAGRVQQLHARRCRARLRSLYRRRAHAAVAAAHYVFLPVGCFAGKQLVRGAAGRHRERLEQDQHRPRLRSA